MNENSTSISPLVDQAGTLKRLGNDRQLFVEFIAIFLEDTPALLNTMKKGIANDDPVDVSRSAHALNGIISNFGAQECVEVAWKIEAAGRSGDVSQCASDFERFEPLFQRLKNELQSIR